MKKSSQQSPDRPNILGKKRMIKQDEILYKQNYNAVGDISHLQILLPVQLKDNLLNSLHGEVGKQSGISKMIQDLSKKYYIQNKASYKNTNG